MARFSILQQRVSSLMTGETRENPIQPLRRQPGVVQIGNQRLRVSVPVTVDLAALDEQRREDYNLAKQTRRPHFCGASEMGMFCGHAD